MATESHKGALILSRKQGQVTHIFADPEATDAELAAAVREGIEVTLIKTSHKRDGGGSIDEQEFLPSA